MSFDITLAGWLALMKALVYAISTVAICAVVLTFENEFSNASALAALGAACFLAFGIVEWASRGWFEDKLSALNTKHHTKLTEAVPAGDYKEQRARLRTAQLALLSESPPKLVVRAGNTLTIATIPANQVDQARRDIETSLSDAASVPAVRP